MGKAIALELADLGADVAVTARTVEPRGDDLTGTVSGGSQSSVMATFDAPPTTATSDPTNPGYHFNAGLYANTLKVADNPLTLVPSSSNKGMTTIQANLVSSTYTAPVPEPSTILLFAATVAGLGLRRQIRRARLAD